VCHRCVNVDDDVFSRLLIQVVVEVLLPPFTILALKLGRDGVCCLEQAGQLSQLVRGERCVPRVLCLNALRDVKSVVYVLCVHVELGDRRRRRVNPIRNLFGVSDSSRSKS